MYFLLFFYVIIVGGIVFDNLFIVFNEYVYDISGGGFSNVFFRSFY